MQRLTLGLGLGLGITSVLVCGPAVSDTVYDVEAIRPFAGNPPTDSAQTTDSQPQTAMVDNSDSNTENEVSGPTFAGEPTVISADDFDTADERKTVVISSRIYQCRDGNANVFVDEDNKAKFSDCALIREQQVVEVVTEPTENPQADFEHCTGMIQFKGNTYVFNDDEPCPIPAGFFQMLTPIEARPDHYLTEPAALDK